MARLGRYSLPDQKLHVIRRGNDRSAIVWLAEAAGRGGCGILTKHP